MSVPEQTPVSGAVGTKAEGRRLDVPGIGRSIALRRDRLGLKQLDLARRAGMSEACINRLENGVVRNPKIQDLALVAGALEVTLETLLYGDLPEPEPDLVALMGRQPRLAAGIASLLRGLQWAQPDDRDFVLTHLESLARRFGDRRHPKNN